MKVKQQVDSSLLIQVVAGNVMEGASMMFHGNYKKRCLLTILVSQTLLLTQLIYEIKKSTTANGHFTTLVYYLGIRPEVGTTNGLNCYTQPGVDLVKRFWHKFTHTFL